MQLKVFRFHHGMAAPRYDTFPIDAVPGLTVLGALFHAQEQYDESLAFRYSCRGAVCGTCAVLINRIPRLACRTQVQKLPVTGSEIHLAPFLLHSGPSPWDPEKEILVEPLPNLPVIRDLIVDMEPFFANYRAINPVFHPAGPAPEKERFMSREAVRELERYTGCILCAACFAACPVNGTNRNYLGPAALAKLYRFHIDPREQGRSARLERADAPDGWWACEFHTNCRRVCPKDVPPDIAIGHARQELKKMKKSSGKRQEEA